MADSIFFHSFMTRGKKHTTTTLSILNWIPFDEQYNRQCHYEQQSGEQTGLSCMNLNGEIIAVDRHALLLQIHIICIMTHLLVSLKVLQQYTRH